MNIHFNTRRFLLLLRKFTKEHSKMYLLYTAGFLGILFLVYGLATLSELHRPFPKELQSAFFNAGLLLGGTVFTASFYSFFAHPSKGIQFLQLPASHSEKILLGFFFTQLVFFGTFILVFSFTDRVMCAFYNSFVAIPDWATPTQLASFNANPLLLGDAKNLESILLFFLLSSIAHFGSLAFAKHAFIKTAIILIIIVAALAFYNQYLMRFLIPGEIMPHGKYFTDSFRIGSARDPQGLVVLPGNWFLSLSVIIPVVIYLCFWTGSYYKLKEKQV